MKTESNRNNMLYHYTSISTLLKILDVKKNEKLCVWATHAKYFNDPYEYNLAISLLKRSMYKYEKKTLSKIGKVGNSIKKLFQVLDI